MKRTHSKTFSPEDHWQTHDENYDFIFDSSTLQNLEPLGDDFFLLGTPNQNASYQTTTSLDQSSQISAIVEPVVYSTQPTQKTSSSTDSQYKKLFSENLLKDSAFVPNKHRPSTDIARRKPATYNKYIPKDFKNPIITEHTTFIPYAKLHGKQKKNQIKEISAMNAVAISLTESKKVNDYVLQEMNQEILDKYYKLNHDLAFVSLNDFIRQTKISFVPDKYLATQAAKLTQQLFPNEYQQTIDSQQRNNQDNAFLENASTKDIEASEQRKAMLKEIYDQSKQLDFETWQNKYNPFFLFQPSPFESTSNVQGSNPVESNATTALYSESQQEKSTIYPGIDELLLQPQNLTTLNESDINQAILESWLKIAEDESFGETYNDSLLQSPKT